MKTPLFLQNYIDGQLKDNDDNSAVPPTFKKKDNNEINQMMNKFIEEQKKIFKSWRESDKQLQNLKIMDMDKYNPLGFNIDLNTKKIYIKDLQINHRHDNTYLKLKISSKICIYNYVIFLGEDENKDFIPISIFDTENYYQLNLDNWEEVEGFFKEGKYILIMNPHYSIYNEMMYETTGIDGLICLSPNEIILFKDEKDLDHFFDLLNKNDPENMKNIGDIMIIRKYYEKAIFYYNKAISNEVDPKKSVKIYSLLCECYLRYKYYTKGIEYIDKCFDLIDNLIKDIKEQLDKTFIMTSLFRKIKCYYGLRNFIKSHEIYMKIKEDIEFQNKYHLDKAYIDSYLNEKNNLLLKKIIERGYNNNLGKYDINQMLIDEKESFFLNNGDYINPKIKIAFNPQKGISMIAQEDIKIGEYILAEKAIYVCRAHDPNNDFESNIKLNTPFHIIENIEKIDSINNLIKIVKKSPLDYKEFFALFNGQNLMDDYESRIGKEPKELLSMLSTELIEDIFKFNWYKTYRYFLTQNKLGIGLWKKFSLFNHSCAPNTTNYGIGDFIFVMPNRLIKKGEEITILYLTTPKLFEDERNGLFKDIYNFKCNCDLCEYERKNRQNNANVYPQYDKYIRKLIDNQNTYQKEKAMKEFPKFLEKNKEYLLEYDIGKAYLELSSSSGIFKEAYKYYQLADKYLGKKYFESKRINLNKILEFADSEIEQGDYSNYNDINKIGHSFSEFHKLFYNCKENDVENFIKINKEQKIKDLMLQQNELIKNMQNSNKMGLFKNI